MYKNTGNITIFVLYVNPNYAIMQRDLHNFFDGRNKVLIVGDLNTRCTTWKNHINNANGNTIYEYYINIYRTQQPTHYPDIWIHTDVHRHSTKQKRQRIYRLNNKTGLIIRSQPDKIRN